MALIIPPAKNYQSPMIVRPEKWMLTPPEGPVQIPMEIAWGTDASTGMAVSCDARGVNPPSTFSQIAALTVDNSQCGADVTFQFPDTGQSYVVPAYQCVPALPVFTSGTFFYVYAPNALSTDMTVFSVHNTMPPVLDLPKSEFQSSLVATNQPLSTTNTVNLSTKVSGTIADIVIVAAFIPSAAADVTVAIEDGNNNVIAFVTLASASAVNFNGQVFSTEGLNVRFQNGLKSIVTVISGAPAGVVNPHVYLRTP